MLNVFINVELPLGVKPPFLAILSLVYLNGVCLIQHSTFSIQNLVKRSFRPAIRTSRYFLARTCIPNIESRRHR
uniref:Uncharacterized protein n=2 Tax=unclassified Caudoviricetes TaxID=2788787 RepID=A0A8S5VAS8_9CAUD|nr:MAG TPA: hypothetical protein [Siphoviridae sp. ctfrT39]DAG03882.1 MAG TPA: hypothetical protein [Siphoviridae sp. ct0vA12]